MPERKERLRELASIFLRLGVTSFGGPVAHIALMRQEFVERREWLSQQQFLDLNGAVNLVPGPNSTELAMYIGQQRAGRAGLWVAGACFIIPAALIVLLIAWFYHKFEQLPAVEKLLQGVAPVVVAIVAQALWKFARTALKGAFPIAIALAALVLHFCHVTEAQLIFGAAAIGLLFGWLQQPRNTNQPPGSTVQAPFPLLLSTAPMAMGKTAGLFWVFVKIGSVIYGSGYVLLAFLHTELVEKLAWISEKQLLDAVAVGQMTPGPVFTTATFIGFQVSGWAGALAATLGIFLPSFLLVGLLSMIIERVQQSPMLRTFLDAVNAASLALMAAVTVELGRHAIAPQDQILPLAVGLFGASIAVLFTTKINSAWLIGVGALLGYLLM
jgi:chromate transporter